MQVLQLQNRRYFNKQLIEIKESGLTIEKKGLFDSSQYTISFDRIDNKKKIQTTINHGVLVTGTFFFVFALLFQVGPNNELTFLFLSIAVLLGVVAFVNRKSTVTIDVLYGEPIELYTTKKNKLEVIEFSDAIIQASNVYFLNKYSKVDRALPIEPQLVNLQFLRDREIISELQYEGLKDELLGRKGASSIGF